MDGTPATTVYNLEITLLPVPSQTLSILGPLDDGEMYEGYAPGLQYMPAGESGHLYMGYWNSDEYPTNSFHRFKLTKPIPVGAIITTAQFTCRDPPGYRV